jgi:hypothetical protein
MPEAAFHSGLRAEVADGLCAQRESLVTLTSYTRRFNGLPAAPHHRAASRVAAVHHPRVVPRWTRTLNRVAFSSHVTGPQLQVAAIV